ncbi:MAG: zinc-binding dehydrogenase, partial [Anaerolineales bacterium]
RITHGAGVEVVLDPIGGRHWYRSYRALAPTGRLVMFGVSSIAPSLRRRPLAAVRFALDVPWLAFNPLRLMNANKGILGVNLGHLWREVPRLRGWGEQIMEWHMQGWLQPRIDAVFSFDDAAQAHARLQNRENIGKVLLKP